MDVGTTTPIAAVRRFNRFYTRQIGVLDRSILESPYSLSEARVLFELAQNENTVAADLVERLQIDSGYLSRMLHGFVRKGLVARERAAEDGRRRLLTLTAAGRRAFRELDRRSSVEIRAMLDRMAAEDQGRLLNAMRTLERLIGGLPPAPVVLRTHGPGDVGWVTYRHGVLYEQEYGFDVTFELLVGQIASRFLEELQPARERLWIAEDEGERVGSVLIADAGDQVAQLRLFLVEPRARGRGVGTALLREAVRFARKRGYEKISLWTQSILEAARHLYEQAGFRKVEETPHHSFGHDLIAEVWELPLDGDGGWDAS